MERQWGENAETETNTRKEILQRMTLLLHEADNITDDHDYLFLSSRNIISTG